MKLKSILCLFAVWIAFGANAAGDIGASGSITTQNISTSETCTAAACVELDITNRGTVSIQIAGTYTGALTLQRSNDRLTWGTLSASTTFTNGAGTQTATIASGTTGTFAVANVAGFKWIRITALDAVTGTATVTIYTSIPGGGGGGGTVGGTSSSFGAAMPATGTAVGASDGTNMVAPRSYDTDSGAGTQNTLGVNLRKAASGGSVELGTSTDPVRTDPTGTTTQPMSAASLPLPAGASTAANQSTTNTNLGAPGDAACGTDTGTCALIPLIKRANTNLTSDPNYSQATGSAVPARALYVAGRTGANAAAVPISGLTAAITMSTATTTQFIALSGTTLTYISSLSIIAGGTTNVTLVYGTGTNCATGQTALTGAYPLTAQTGLALSGMPAIVVPSGQALCVTSSAAVQVSGHITHTQY